MKKLVTTVIALSALGASQVMAQSLSIKITNLSNAIYFTPLLIAAHDNSNQLFMVGAASSASLQTMAEGGDISELSTEIQAVGANVVENPAQGLLDPGAMTSFTLMTDDANTHLSITAMILPSNDGFVGKNSLEIPTTAGTYTYFLNAYDAGTEANNELVVEGSGASGVLGIPVDPSGSANSNGTGITNTTENNMIHIHRGTVGDMNSTGGISDLTSTVHRWLNPIAQLVITVN